MIWTDLHAKLIGNAFKKVLGKADQGAMAFVRCLTPNIVELLAHDETFSPPEWQVWRVAGIQDENKRTITADHAVELRESKKDAILLLVDTSQAGAGMDGIYSAACEINEAILFAQAASLAKREVTRCLSRQIREYAERAIKKARGYGQRFNVSLWTEFSFLASVAAQQRHPGELLYMLGLWPVQLSKDVCHSEDEDLNSSRMFVERLLGTAVSGLPFTQRIESLKLLDTSEEQISDLECFLRSASAKALLPSLADLANRKNLWVNALQIAGATQAIRSIELSSWRTRTGKVSKWSGLYEEGNPDEPPVLIINPDADRTGEYSKLEVHWKAQPDNLEKGAVEYQVVIVTDMDEDLATRDVSHTGKKEEKCIFTNDDFSMLSEEALISSKVVVSVIGNDSVEHQESEEFLIRFGQPPESETGGVGKKVRTFADGLIELDDRNCVSEIISSSESFPMDAKGFVLLRTSQRGKNFRVFCPPLIREVEQQWADRSGEIGRWRVKVRSSGARATILEFVPFARSELESEKLCEVHWERATTASRKMTERFAVSGGGIAQIYDEKSKVFETVVKEYMLAWSALLENGDPSLALVNTVEIQSLSGQTIGLIVLPSHPLRVAWHAAYDNLVLYAKFEQGMTPKDVREEFGILDGTMFPEFLPGLKSGSTFVFADTIGFHAVGMVPDNDKEPKAAVAIFARALGESETSGTMPTVGKLSAQVLGNEILKYIECHDTSKLLHIHALRPGDGFTVARALSCVQDRYRRTVIEEDIDDGEHAIAPLFVLEIYPSQEQRGVAGRFIAEAREKRRSGTGVLSTEDHWMLESLSLPGGMNIPRLRWARKIVQDPTTAAHLAVAFDTFESQVVLEQHEHSSKDRPLFVFGLLSFFERKYTNNPSPLWYSAVSASTDGEKHPSDRTHTERLVRLQLSIHRSVAHSLGEVKRVPALRTEISPEKAHSLQELHRLSDWVITLDRNAGIEYFDSPHDNKEIYNAYVIDCVPEREDLGCLQLITSTSNLEEVRNLLDGTLDQMGLSRSRRNAEFLMMHLKALSGRLAIRLTGQRAPTSELIALALCHANCWQASDDGDCWTPLQDGFLIPVDDIRGLLPPLSTDETNQEERETRPDLIYVCVVPRKGLSFRFVEVKYRRHLRTARSPDILYTINRQVEGLHKRWNNWYVSEDVPSTFRAIRRSKLARILRFYADKAHRHYLPGERYEIITKEISRMIEKGGGYSFANIESANRGWVFCPEYVSINPLEITPVGCNTRTFLFGSGYLPDSAFHRESISIPPSGGASQLTDPINKPEEKKNQFSESGNTSDMQSDKNAIVASKDSGTPSVSLGADLLTGTDVSWPLTVKGNPHLLVAGLPGMGKTTFLLNMCKQMLDEDIRPIVFSYHQDIDERLESFVESVRFVDFNGLAFNPLQVIDRQSRLSYLDVAGSLRDIFMAIFPELGDIQGERIRKAIKESFIENGWDDPNANLADLQEPPFARFVEILFAEQKPDRGLKTLLARLEELGDYGFFKAAQSQENLWESSQPIVIRIHSTQNDNLQKAFASLVFYGLYKDMFRRGTSDHITHAIVFDEAHRAARLLLLPTMAKECRKYGISLVLASQEARDFNISLFSAIANYLVLRLTEADAKALVRNVASSEQERVLIDKIKQMDRFKAIYFSEGKKKPSIVSLPA
jgi:DNA phosphorothioation-dependent restriction protein DptH